MVDGGGAEPGLTRRALLQAVPGVGAALALGCPSPFESPPPGEIRIDHIQGSIVGASHQLGHRLRSDDLPEPQETRRVPVVIAGAGIAGLSAGWKLAQSGFRDFEILELEAQAGGNSRWGESSVSAYPWGAHYVPLPTPESTAVREVLEEMGMVQDHGPGGEPIYDPRHLCHFPQERVFIAGRWYGGLSARDLMAPGRDPTQTAAGAAREAMELSAFEERVDSYRRYRDRRGRPAFALPMDLSSHDPELLALDGLSMRQYFDRAAWVSPRLRWYVDYCCRDDYGCTLETTSAWAGWHYFCSRSPAAEYLTWPEGNGRIVRHLLERIGNRLRTGLLVYRVRPTSAGPAGPPGGEGVEVDVFDTESETTLRVVARQVIYALPRFTAPYVLEGYHPAGLEEFTYCPWVVANLTVRQLPPDAAWDNVLYHSPSLGYVVATHQDLRLAPGPSVLTYYLPLSTPDPHGARRQMLERSWSDWVVDILSDLAIAHPEIASWVTRVDLMLWGHAMIRPVPGFLWGDARRRALEPYGPVRFAHSDMSGLSLFEEAQYRGVAAAEDLLRSFGHSYTSSLAG